MFARLLLLLLCLIVPPVQAGIDLHPLQWVATLQQMKQEKKLPGLTRDGVTLPQALLLDQLRKSANDPRIVIQSLDLRPNHGTLKVLAHAPVDVLLTVDFSNIQVDWPHRQIWMQFTESARSPNPTLLGNMLASLAIAAFEAAAGKEHVKMALADKPYFLVRGNRLGVLLEKTPTAQDILKMQLAGIKVFDHVGIQQMQIEPEHLRVHLGLMN